MAIPITQMRAVVHTEIGSLSKSLKIVTINRPIVVKNNEVLIKVVAFSINPVDAMIVNGTVMGILDFKLPQVLSFDAAGIVVQIGANVTKFQVGDEVYSRVDHEYMGTAAEYCITSEQSVALKPKTLTFDQAAAVPNVALTALQSLRDFGHLQPGERILILNGSGGVGTFAVQIASKVLGASEVIVTTSSSSFELVKSLGATELIDYKTENYVDKVKEIDIVADLQVGSFDSFSVLKKGGRVVSIVSPFLPDSLKRAGLKPTIAKTAEMMAYAAPTLAKFALHGHHYESTWTYVSGAELTEIADWIDAGTIRPVIDRVFPFDQAIAAFEHVAARHSKGKVVVHVQDP